MTKCHECNKRILKHEALSAYQGRVFHKKCLDSILDINFYKRTESQKEAETR
jgi:hypothetical protein